MQESNAYAIGAAIESTRIRRAPRVARALHALQHRRTASYQKYCDGAAHDKRAAL
jgi:hypothetical protein